VNRFVGSLLAAFLLVSFSHAEETSFPGVQIPNANGRRSTAVLTFSDKNKAIEVRPLKGPEVTIPYNEITQCSYQYTKKHRVSTGTIALAATGVGAVVLLTKSRIHWLEIDYREQNLPKVFVIRMDKHQYLRILDALKAHTGIDAQVLGNADKR